MHNVMLLACITLSKQSLHHLIPLIDYLNIQQMKCVLLYKSSLTLREDFIRHQMKQDGDYKGLTHLGCWADCLHWSSSIRLLVPSSVNTPEKLKCFQIHKVICFRPDSPFYKSHVMLSSLLLCRWPWCPHALRTWWIVLTHTLYWANSMSSAHKASSVTSPLWWRMWSFEPTRTSWQPAAATSGALWPLQRHAAQVKCWSFWIWSPRCLPASSTSSTAQMPHQLLQRTQGGWWQLGKGLEFLFWSSLQREKGRTKVLNPQTQTQFHYLKGQRRNLTDTK